MRSAQGLMFMGLLVVLLAACRKERDDQPPTVRILEPGNGFVINVPDTFTVRVEVSDERIVRSVTIALADVNGVPVSPPVTATVDNGSATVVRDLVVSDERLLSGAYTLTARASDGANESRAFRSVQLQAAPLRTRAVFITPPFGQGQAAILRIDSTGAVSTFTTVQDLNGAAIDSHDQHLLLAGGLTAPLVALPTAAGANTWQLPNLNADGLPYFNGLRRDPTDGRFYVATGDGHVRGFTGSGSQTFTGQVLPSFRGLHTVLVGERMATVQRSISLPDTRLVTLARASGALIGQYPLDLEVVDMYRRTDQHALIFGNRDGSGIVQDRNVEQGGGFEPREFPGTPILATVRLDGNNWVIALPGQLVRYAHASNGLTLLASGIDAQALALDAASGALYVGTADAMLTMDPVTGAVLATLPVAGGVGRILPLLNR